MKEKVTAVISLAGSIIFILFSFVSIINDNVDGTKETLIMIAFLAFFASNILYITWTKFGNIISRQ